MTIYITFLGLLGGSIMGFFTGVITTYIRVPVTWRTSLIALVVLVLVIAILRWVSFSFALDEAGDIALWWKLLCSAVLLAALVFFRRYIGVALSFLAQLYILLIRGTPIVVQVMFIYFALPLLVGWRIDGVSAAIFTLVINSGAYIAEIVRGALQSVSKGLQEAGQAMGLPFHKILIFIIAPVAWRRMIPAMGNQCIISLKDSSLFIVIGVAELTRQGQEIIASNFRSVEIWAAVAVIYLILTGFIALTLKLIEHRMRSI